MMFDSAAFKRGKAWAARRQELRIQGAFTRTQFELKEMLLEGGLAARRTADGPDDEHIAGLMRDWLLIHEELGGHDGR